MSVLTGPSLPGGEVAARLEAMPTGFVCDGCGFEAPRSAPAPQRCPAARSGDDIDHVIRRVIDLTRVGFPAADGGEPASPFETYRPMFHAYHVARAIGWSDDDYVALVRNLDDQVAAVEGHGFRATPLGPADALRAALGLSGAVYVKNETGNVSGSHKARHLMGTALELQLADELRDTPGTSQPLAIASCGNAALAAAVVAAAWERELLVFVPEDAEPSILAGLRDLRATVTTVARDPDVPGDPTYHAMRRAVERGALPFTCQGPDNAFAIDGGRTLGYELGSQLAADGVILDRLCIQVGGGALAASLAAALEEAAVLRVVPRLPRIHAVQSRDVQPLARAYRMAVGHLVEQLDVGRSVPEPDAPPGAWRALADTLRPLLASPAGASALAGLPRHRSTFMWPWGDEPHSVAGGIVDDETYDWFAVVRAMLRTGGWPLVADEATLLRAAEIGSATTGIDADPTGTAGLAGLMTLLDAGGVDPAEHLGLVFTGIRRTPVHGETR